jgi:hypothetical protein
VKNPVPQPISKTSFPGPSPAPSKVVTGSHKRYHAGLSITRAINRNRRPAA